MAVLALEGAIREESRSESTKAAYEVESDSGMQHLRRDNPMSKVVGQVCQSRSMCLQKMPWKTPSSVLGEDSPENGSFSAALRVRRAENLECQWFFGTCKEEKLELKNMRAKPESRQPRLDKEGLELLDRKRREATQLCRQRH